MNDDSVVMQIWDNGRGAQVINEGIGLAGMRERMREIGGAVNAANTTDGFEVTARIPWRDGRPE
jgi:signal transduction histidine kinase